MKIKPKRPNNSKKYKTNINTVWGMNNSLALISSHRFKIICVTIQKSSIAWKSQKIQNWINRSSLPIRVLQKTEFIKKYENVRTQGIVIQFNGEIISKIPDFTNISGNNCLLLLDQITDPQNLGQIIRTSECAGVSGIIIPKNNNVGITDAVLQVSQGAFVYQPIYECGNIHQTLLKLKDQGFWVVGVENGIETKLWYDIDYSGKIAIILGCEGRGIRPLVLKTCDFLTTIPMAGKVNSLNVTAAVSTILFERNRQLMKK